MYVELQKVLHLFTLSSHTRLYDGE